MSNILEPHPLAALFPELPPEELAELARDIKKRGQLEPIILHKGLILDGQNRYRACQIAGLKPQTEEFNPKAARRSPSEFVLSRNLRRRHLSVGQKAAIALEWSEQIQLSPRAEKNRRRGRPKGALTEAAKNIGIKEQRVFEVRQVRDADPALYRKVKAGSHSLRGALAEVSLPRKTRLSEPDLDDPERGDGANKRFAIFHPVVGRVGLGVRRPANKETTATTKPAPSGIEIEKALARIKQILGSWFYGEVKGRNLIQNSEEIVQFSKLTETQMREIGSLLKKGWAFGIALQEVAERLTPDDEIRALHTRAVASGGNWYISSVGNFAHIVAWGSEKDKILARLREALAKPFIAHRS